MIDNITAKTHAIGVSVCLQQKKNYIWLSCFRVPRNKRNRGLAKKAIKMLCKYADENYIVIKGYSFAMDRFTDQNRLDLFYKKYGFEIKNNRMIRKPQQRRATWQK